MQSLRRLVNFVVPRRGLKQLVFTRHGAPLDVLSMTDAPKPQWRSGMTEVKVLIASINPTDVNVVEGIYPHRPDLTKDPGISGMDCVAEVIRSDVFDKGDRVIVTHPLWGTWREAGLVPDKYLYKIPEKMSNLEAVSTFGINPFAAYLMLTEFVKLKAGDCVVQNAATNAVALFVMQLCRAWGVKTINIIRDYPDPKLDRVKLFLRNYGADIVCTDEEYAQGWKKLVSKEIPRPRLALNCLAGKSAGDLCKGLADAGTMVTFGGLSRQPSYLPTTAIVFRDIRADGFLLTRWRTSNDSKFPDVNNKILDDILRVAQMRKFKTPDIKVYPFADWQNAMMHAQLATAGLTSQKIVFCME